MGRDPGGGGVVALAGLPLPLRPFVRPASASLNGSKTPAVATSLVSLFTLLKLGSFAFCFGAEKKDESVLASVFTASAAAAGTTFFVGPAAGVADDADAAFNVDVLDKGLEDEAAAVACLFAAVAFVGAGSALRLLDLAGKEAG
jgi:hypothetical protein